MSGYTTTPHYSLRKPVVGGDTDNWGSDLNVNADTLDTIVWNTNSLLANYLPLTGGTLTGNLTFSGASSLNIGDPRYTGMSKAWADASGNVGAYIALDGTWQLPAVGAKTFTVPTATITTLSGATETYDTITVRTAGTYSANPLWPVARAWTDPTGAANSVIMPDGTWQMRSLVATTVTVTNLTATNFTQPGASTPSALQFGNVVTSASDRRNRYTNASTDSADQAAFALTSTGSVAFAPASGVLAKHSQSRIERSHVMTAGPPSHSDSANVAGVANTTHHLCCTLDTIGYEAIRLVIPSMGLTAGGVLTACIAPSASATDKLNPVDGTGNPVPWKPVTFISAGQNVNWEDQPFGSISLTTTNAVTPQGSSTLTFADTTGVTVGMVCYIPTNGTASGIYLADHWARVTAVSPTTVTLSKPIQNGWNMGGTGVNGLPVSWPCWFSPEKLTVPAWPGNGSGSQVTLLTSDWIPLSSLDRSDGGRWPILLVRIYGATAGFTTLDTDLSPDWSGYTQDRIWTCMTQTGDFVSDGTQSGFTNSTDNGIMALGFVQYYSRTRGCTMMWSGDSITQGINTGSMEGHGAVIRAARQLSTPAVPVTAVGMVNGWNGCGLGQGIWASSIAHIDVFQPQVLAQCTWSRNGEFNVPPSGTPPYSQNSADWYFQQTLRIAQKAMRRYRTQILYFPMGPSDAVEMTAATEAVRMTGTVRARQAAQSGEMLLDQDLLLGTGSTPVNDTYYPGLHPPAPAQMILSLSIVQQVKSALGI